MKTGGSVKRRVTLTILAGVAILALAQYYLNRPSYPYLFGRSDARIGEALSGQRILKQSLTGSIAWRNVDRDAMGRLTMSVDLVCESLQKDRREFAFLLHQGFTITSATINGKAVRPKRNGVVVTLKTSDPLPEATPVTVHIEYSGNMPPMAYAYQSAIIGPDRTVLPHLSLWHPIDLHSFFTMQCSMEIPSDWVPVVSNATETNAGRTKRAVWEEPRPVLGASFAAGPYTKTARTHGAVQCVLFRDRDTSLDERPILDLSGEAYSYLRVLYESDGFDRINLLVDPNFTSPYNGGNAFIALPETLPTIPREQFALLARQIAYNWWGNMVTGRWFTEQPDAASWLVHGFAEYSAWLALRGVRGQTDYLRYLETRYCSPSIDFPMKTITLGDSYASGIPWRATDSPVQLVRQPFTLAVFAAQVGEEPILAAAKNLLRIHRFRAISYVAALQEMELASESDLRETFRVWFERGGTFDYAIDDVISSDAGVRILVSNPGDIPVFGELAVALVAGGRVTQTAIEPGANGGSFLLPVDAPVDTIILDPAFTYPDMLRGNNVWPRRDLPRAVQGFPSGEILLTANPNPMGRGADRLALLAPDLGHSDRVNLPSELTSDPVGRSDATMFLLEAGPIYVWSPGGSAVDEIAREGSSPLSWTGDIAYLQHDRTGDWYRWAPESAPISVASNDANARPGSLVQIAAGNQSVYVSAQSSQIRRVSWEEFRDEPLECPAAASNLAWNAAGGFVVYVSIGGAIIKLDPVSETYETILQLEYAPLLAKVSPEGAYVAWLDPRNQLWYCNSARTQPKVATIEGEPVSLSWMNDETLLVLTAEPLSAIPAHAHATYSLWRVDAIRHKAERLPVNPSQVF